jgi:hypothetical protein
VVQVYVTPATKRFYISRTAMRQLGIIGPDFPRINTAEMARAKTNDSQGAMRLPQACTTAGEASNITIPGNRGQCYSYEVMAFGEILSLDFQ